MKAVNKNIYQLILELQTFDILKSFSLAGGTNLALRYNHRISDDIDLFTNEIIGLKVFKKIKKFLQNHFKDKIKFSEIINEESGNQFCFLRALIVKNKMPIKVELIQNIQYLFEVEKIDNVKIVALKDIGIFKLKSACSRKAKKDIYDLDFITDEISLSNLLDLEKQELYNSKEKLSLFELDGINNAYDNILQLLAFDDINYTNLPLKPSHSNHRIQLLTISKPWAIVKQSWRSKVREVLFERNIPLPPIKPIN